MAQKHSAQFVTRSQCIADLNCVLLFKYITFDDAFSDHIAQIYELLGSFPLCYVLLGSLSHLYFTKQGDACGYSLIVTIYHACFRSYRPHY